MQADWYDYPLWYDVLHTPGTAREVDGLEAIEKRFTTPALRRTRRWLEPACGSGRYLRVAAARGVRVVGVDLNQRMIDYARDVFARRKLSGQFLCADITDFDLSRAARATFAFCLINSIRHLPSDRAVVGHLRCMARALAPGAVYAVGIDTCRYGVDFASEDVWHGARGSLRITQVVQYDPPTRAARRERVITHLAIHQGHADRARTTNLDSAYDLRGYSRRQWTALIARAGWKILARCDPFGDEALIGPSGDPVGGYAVWILTPSAGALRNHR